MTNGLSANASGETHAFLWHGGIMIDLGTLGGGFSWATRINGRGQIVGISTTDSGDAHAFLWSGGTMTDLGTLDGTSSIAYGINDPGQIVGASTLNDENHAVLWLH